MSDVMNVAAQLIGSIGFPIFMCILLFKHLETEQDNHKQEIQKLTDVIHELKVTLVSIRSALGGNDAEGN